MVHAFLGRLDGLLEEMLSRACRRALMASTIPLLWT